MDTALVKLEDAVAAKNRDLASAVGAEKVTQTPAGVRRVEAFVDDDVRRGGVSDGLPRTVGSDRGVLERFVQEFV